MQARGVNGLQPAQLSARELIMWTAGWLAGYESGEIVGRAAGHDEHGSRCIEYYAELVRMSGRVSEAAGRSKAWNEQHRTSP
jgi:hypothetical protein